MNLLTLFIILNVINVLIQTVKSIVTIKCGKLAAALINALAYGLYTVVIIYTVCDLPLMQKALIVAAANFIGVYIVKAIEEKLDKVKLWKIEMTIPTVAADEVDKLLVEIPHSLIKISDKHSLVSCYCSTKAETEEVRRCGVAYHAKFFAAENKL